MKIRPSRRNLLSVSGAAGVAATLPRGVAAASRAPKYETSAWLQSVVERYSAFGVKASGGVGDEACGAWLEADLTRLGYTCRRQAFEAPFFEPVSATLTCGAATAQVSPQALVTATGPAGVTAPLRCADREGDLSGAIALVVLPYKRWVSLVDPMVARPLGDAFKRGALAAVLVTNGPTGEAIALNVSTHNPGFDRPVAILAPKQAQPFITAAITGQAARLVVDGHGGRRKAFNLIARLDRKAAQTVVISTPRSGWFSCTSERGSGLAVWLSLAHALAASRYPVNVELLCTSGHEYEYLGGELYLNKLAPPPSATKLWLHIGASAASRDWHELGPALHSLPSADPQRVLTATADIIDLVRPCFKGVTGLEATYVADKTSAGGELTNVLSAGYRTAIGLYGAHRFFHTRYDDLRCTSGDLIQPVAASFQLALEASIRS